MEQWKTVEYLGFNLLVSDLGRVKRPERTVTKTRTRFGKTQTFESIEPERLMACPPNVHGYPEVSVMVDKKRKKFPVHRLVATAFCPGFEDGLHVDHINGVKTDNRAVNLEWVTNRENVRRAWANDAHIGLVGEANPVSKLTQKQVRIIRTLLRRGVTQNMLADLLQVSFKTIQKIADGETWKSVA